MNKQETNLWQAALAKTLGKTAHRKEACLIVCGMSELCSALSLSFSFSLALAVTLYVDLGLLQGILAWGNRLYCIDLTIALLLKALQNTYWTTILLAFNWVTTRVTVCMLTCYGYV
jgi:hypothetical protein